MSVFVIAELGINHNGALLTALKLIDEAKKAGADAVKFQKRNLESTYTKEELDKTRESPWGNTNRQQKQGLEFSKEAYDEIARHCKDVGIQWSASPWDLPSVEFLKQYNLPFNKIASALMTHTDLVTEIAKQKKLTYISTGMSTIAEITRAINIFSVMNCPYELMHCTSTYPQSESETNLWAINKLHKLFHCNVGYSSHSTGIISPVMAAVLGATSIEAHLTLDRSMYGSDQSASLEPGGFAKMVEYIRHWDIIKGDGNKKVYPSEEPILKKLRRVKDY